MKPNRVLGALLAVSLGFAPMVGAPDDVYAQAQGKQDKAKPKGKGRAAKASAPANVVYNPLDAPTTTKPIAWEPAALKWGMSKKEVTAVIESQLNTDYQSLLKKVQPGVKMKALEAALEEAKATFKRSVVEFGKLPTGFDSTPLKGEYSYQNKEMMMTLVRRGQTREFFYIQNRLWKFIDEIALGEGTFYGATFQDAVVKLSSILGVPGRLMPPDPSVGRYTTEVDWKDSITHLRAIERNETSFALGYEELATLGNLSTLRSYKPPIDSGIDPAVADAMRGGGGGATEPSGAPKSAAPKSTKTK